MLFSQSPQLAVEDLRRYAGQVGLDVTKFDGCLAAGVHKAAVQRDLDYILALNKRSINMPILRAAARETLSL